MSLDSTEIFVSKQILPANTTIKIGLESFDSPNYDSWMFFINRQPLANWGHPCSYIFIGVNNKEIDILEKNFYPTSPSLVNMDKINSSVVTFDKSTLIKPVTNKQASQTRAT